MYTHQCAPSRNNTIKTTSTCMTLEELLVIAKEYNLLHKKNQIDVQNNPSVAKLHQSLKTRLNCENGEADVCIIEKSQSFTKNKINEAKILKPVKPKSWNENDHEWLSNLDIDKVLRQYELAYPGFKFVGAVPLDAARTQPPPMEKTNRKTSTKRPPRQMVSSTGLCTEKEMCTILGEFRINHHPVSFNRFAVVYNLDYSHQPGSHWVSLFCDFRKGSKKYGAYYFNSTGYTRTDKQRKVKPIPTEIEEFVNKIKPKYPLFKLQYNELVYQVGGSECGMFSLVFVILCLMYPDETYKETRARIVKSKQDEWVHFFRNVLFRNNTTISR